MMFASFVFVKICFFSHRGFFRRSFCHRGHPYFVWWSLKPLSQGSATRASTPADSNGTSITMFFVTSCNTKPVPFQFAASAEPLPTYHQRSLSSVSVPNWTTLTASVFAQNRQYLPGFQYLRPWSLPNFPKKMLLPMKLFSAFFVFTGEGNDKLNVAEIEHHDDNC